MFGAFEIVNGEWLMVNSEWGGPMTHPTFWPFRLCSGSSALRRCSGSSTSHLEGNLIDKT